MALYDAATTGKTPTSGLTDVSKASKASPWGGIASSLVAGGMSLLGAYLGKPEQQDPTVNVTGVVSSLQPNAPTYALPSDKSVKENVSGASDDIREFLGLSKDRIANTKIGKDMIDENGEISYGPRTVEKLLSIVASLGHRISQLEKEGK